MTEPGHEPPEEGYLGEAVLRAGDRDIPVRAELTGRLGTFDGRYRWSGRLVGRSSEAGAGELTALRRGSTVELRVPGGEPATGTLREPDPWSAVRITGTGRPPFPLPEPPDDLPTAQDGRTSPDS